MKEVLYLDRLEQAEILLKPQRVEVLRQLAEPRSCPEVAAVLGQTTQRVYYHVVRLVEAGLVAKVSERKVRGIHEGVYQAVARSYWLSPGLVGQLEPRRVRDQFSLGFLLNLLEEVQTDIAGIEAPTAGGPEIPSLGLLGEIHIRPEERKEFLDVLQSALKEIFTRYGGAEGERFKLAVACYPQFSKE
jgi:hypothetical protein